MSWDSVVAMLERDHQAIDADIEGFLDDRRADGRDTGLLMRAMSALRRHIYLEEEFVFPALPDPGLAAPVFVMLREHAQIWQLLDSLQEEIGPDHGSGAAAAELCRQLAVLLLHHNRKEERVVYTAATRTIAPETLRRVAEIMQVTSEAPPHWVCVRARR